MDPVDETEREAIRLLSGIDERCHQRFVMIQALFPDWQVVFVCVCVCVCVCVPIFRVL